MSELGIQGGLELFRCGIKVIPRIPVIRLQLQALPRFSYQHFGPPQTCALSPHSAPHRDSCLTGTKGLIQPKHIIIQTPEIQPLPTEEVCTGPFGKNPTNYVSSRAPEEGPPRMGMNFSGILLDLRSECMASVLILLYINLLK